MKIGIWEPDYKECYTFIGEARDIPLRTSKQVIRLETKERELMMIRTRSLKK